MNTDPCKYEVLVNGTKTHPATWQDAIAEVMSTSHGSIIRVWGPRNCDAVIAVLPKGTLDIAFMQYGMLVTGDLLHGHENLPTALRMARGWCIVD